MSEEKIAGYGLSKAEGLYRNYGVRAKELKEQGQKVIAYVCALVPLEIIAAAGFIPLRIRGDVNEPITKGDVNLETIACPYARSCFDVSVKGRYSFCDGLAIPHSCDSIARTYSVWRYVLDFPYSHFVNVPHTVNGSSLDFFRADIENFRKSLEQFANKKISDSDLAHYVELYNENRRKVRALYELRRQDPPLLAGSEMIKILLACLSLPVQEANQLLIEVHEEISGRKENGIKKLPRIMVFGSTIDNPAFMSLIEESGANVVVDNLCIGTREFWPQTPITADPLDGIADRYLKRINCPRTCKERKEGETFADDLESRFGDMGALIRDYAVDGVILYIYKYCDPFGFEIPARKAYLESLNVPVLYIEDEYSAGTIGSLRTRIQAFLEVIE
ncbi:MAG: 2-hydroxyacyl-CoA dehydratase subunit D [Syntrophales bacterium]